MMIRHIKGAQHIIGQDQGYLGLPVKWVQKLTMVDGVERMAPFMETAWEPTPAELERINAGHSIIISIMGVQHPPIMLSVTDEKVESESLDAKAKLVKQAMEALESLKIHLGSVLYANLGRVVEPSIAGDKLQWDYNRVCNALREVERINK